MFGTGGFFLAAQQHAAMSEPRREHREAPFSDVLNEKLVKVVELGINPVLFVALWKAAFDQRDSANGLREKEFCHGFADIVLGAAPVLQEELALVSEVLESGFGRFALTGRWASVTSDSANDLRLRFQHMAGSWFVFRRKALMGILVIVGMSHFSREMLQSDCGYPGVPEHVKSIWRFSEGLDGKSDLGTPRAREFGE